MPCYQTSSLPSGTSTAGRTAYQTEAACLEACKEGACCEGTTCTVKPACQCQGAGKTFKGVGTTCSSGVCDPCCQGALQPTSLLLQITSVDRVAADTVSLSFALAGSYVLPAVPVQQASVEECFRYADLFFANPSPCSTQASNCTSGCLYKLRLSVDADGRVFVGVCDSQATYTPGGVANAGGEVWGYIPEWHSKVCGRSAFSGTTTYRNNPNYGGVLNAVSYSISFA